MRVISGKYRSRQLKTIASSKTRPTTDKNKENLFNMLAPYLKGGNVLDLFAGSGSLGIEAISRGMDYLYCVDKAYPAFKIIKENLDSLKIENALALKMDYKKALDYFVENNIQFDLVLLDPPYRMKKNLEIIHTMIEQNLLNPGCIIVVEDVVEEKIDFEGEVEVLKENTYGITILQIVRYNG